MRVAFTGSHRTGKTSLVEALGEELRGYTIHEEPYRLLEEDGHEMSDPPATEDFQAQLRRSIELVDVDESRVLFDRCPLDFIAYLHAIGAADEADDALDDVRDAIRTLDLIVFVPIEEPDRIALPGHEDRKLRRAVDAKLRALLFDDGVLEDTPIVEVVGSLAQRVSRVRQAIDD